MKGILKKKFGVGCAIVLLICCIGSAYATPTTSFSNVNCALGKLTTLTSPITKTDTAKPYYSITKYTPTVNTAGNWQPSLSVHLYVSSTGARYLSHYGIVSTTTRTFEVDDPQNAVGLRLWIVGENA